LIIFSVYKIHTQSSQEKSSSC